MPTPLRSPLQVGPHSRERGFALLMTLTLLAFLVLLLVGLATYTRVETAIAGNTQRQAQARENALFALNIAVGQLQKYAGPDQRVTATAAAFENRAGTRPYTGVWSTEVAPDSEAKLPLTWLVSGNELADADGVPAPLAVTPETALTATTAVALVSINTSPTTNDVLAQLVAVTAMGVPGVATTTSATIGRYAWWVGDQGVKAPVAVPDKTAEVNYDLYAAAEVQSRIRQQMSLGAGAVEANSNETPAFEPRDSNNVALVRNQNIAAAGQMAFLRNAANTPLGLLRVQQNFHHWSPNNYAVLANTKLGGLRRDLSIAAPLLGEAFAAWTNYANYMEGFSAPLIDPVTGEAMTTPTITPAYGDEPVRRRYKISPSIAAQGGVHGVSPVLAVCGLSFNVRTEDAGDGPLEARARWYVSLWNPYTSALVPENLRLEIEGLPDPVICTVTVTPPVGPPITTTVEIKLYELFGDAAHPGYQFPIRLKWDHEKVPGQPDMQSWLPGRTYTWISKEHSRIPTPEGGMLGEFYITDFSAAAGQGETRSTRSDPFPATAISSISFSTPVRLVAKLYRERDDALMGTYQAPEFLGIPGGTAPSDAKASDYQFGFIFRLFESGHVDVGDKSEWLTNPDAVDFRNPEIPATAFRFDSVKADDPAQYRTALDFNDSKFLFDRTQTSTTSFNYNEDVPLFELPRGPLLSIGQLQHFAVENSRPFTIGNSWSSGKAVNNVPVAEFFDRFYFSGLTEGITPSVSANGDLVPPNSLLKPLRKADGNKVAIEDVRAAMGGMSSPFFLQSGAFNLNSVNVTAWSAVLRGIRYPAPETFSYLNVADDTGTGSDTDIESISSADAHFFRFSQTAQETYKAERLPPANTDVFRQGLRTFDAKQLAEEIVKLIQLKHAAAGIVGGPFRSLEEFLAPSDLFGAVDADGNAGPARSLLDAAIADTELNAKIPEFSSQWLTQADVMTALAPILFPRSDTFIVRAYGEAVNPATNATEGRAWCEAIVQRLPEFMDPADPPETELASFDLPSNPDDPDSTVSEAHVLNKTFGRRFKIVSFRWLTRSDI